MDFDIRNDEPVVSIGLITYNHAEYIRPCLDSLLAQETNFPFEIVLGEDYSKDSTRAICIDYADRHPDRIRLILRSQDDPGREEFLSQGVYNYIETSKACRGRYLALCDGDDLWLDSQKLQKQFDIMEANPEVSLVHSDFDQLDVISGCLLKRAGRKFHMNRLNLPQSPSLLDVLQRDYRVAASTAFMKTKEVLEVYEDNPVAFRSCPMGDTTTWCELIRYGPFYFQDESSSIYRILPESESHSLTAERSFKFVNGATNLGLMLGEKYDLPMDKIRAEKVKCCNRYALLSGDRDELDKLFQDKDFIFSSSEKNLYLAGKFFGIRAIVKWMFQIRYKINTRIFNTTRKS